jgi:hypothetical protein
MYHELSHDVLNLEDLPKNEGKLMFPSIATYESKTMDDFIESSHVFFEEIMREYTYAAGETNSKVTARQKAIEQVKVCCLKN